jgi:hypothetical protein
VQETVKRRLQYRERQSWLKPEQHAHSKGDNWRDISALEAAIFLQKTLCFHGILSLLVGGSSLIRTVERPTPAPSEALVRVHAFSLNVGDIYRISQAESGVQLGWDLAGIVEQAAADGSGPKTGTRVTGLLVAPHLGPGHNLLPFRQKILRRSRTRFLLLRLRRSQPQG